MIALAALGIAILITLIIAFIIILIGYTIEYNSYEDGSPSYKEVAHLSWKTIKDLYKVNPSRWRYEKVHDNRYGGYITGDIPILLYNTGNAWRKNGVWDGCYVNSHEIVRIQMSFPTWLIFNYYRTFKTKRTVGEEMILNTAQKDINVLRQRAQNQIDQANKMMDEIKNRLKEE